ncbi:MAG: DMT family transporter [Chloroflexota bacterium]
MAQHNGDPISPANTNPNIQGIYYLIAGMFVLSLQNIAVRAIYEGYAVLQIVVIRSLVALPLILLFFRYEGHRGLPKTSRTWLQFLRGLTLFVAYTTYFMGLAAIPLADAASIRFSSPLFITFFSVFLLGEVVGIRRWGALAVGFLGVLLIVQPGMTGFNIGSGFVFITAVLYALSAIITRRLKQTDSSATMAYYSTLVYLGLALLIGPALTLVGESPNTHPSLGFLFRAWALPTLVDLSIMIALGFIWAIGIYFTAKAYSLALASVAAPFEYTTLPINVIWGFLLWQEIPIIATWLGAALTIISSLYILYRDRLHSTPLKATSTE